MGPSLSTGTYVLEACSIVTLSATMPNFPYEFQYCMRDVGRLIFCYSDWLLRNGLYTRPRWTPWFDTWRPPSVNATYLIC